MPAPAAAAFVTNSTRFRCAIRSGKGAQNFIRYYDLAGRRRELKEKVFPNREMRYVRMDAQGKTVEVV